MMTKVIAYQCSFCHRLFTSPGRHKACGNDPATIHCGQCENLGHAKARIEYDGNSTPRKISCPDYKPVDVSFDY
jgi:hypothetical protein